jgi:hypothetical protein
MIKYFIVSLLVGYILRKFIFYPINQPRPHDTGHYQQPRQENPRPQDKPTKKINPEEYTDYEEIK